MSDSNSFSFFGIPDNYYSPQIEINLHHKKVSDSRITHMLQNFPPPAQTVLDPSNITNISSFVALQNTANLTRSCGDLRGQLNGSSLTYGDNILLQEAKVVGSGESLDCLLSATYTNTDTNSIEDDDGISSLFCDGRSLWTFGSSPQANAITSGESAGNCQQNSSNQLDNQSEIQVCFPDSGVVQCTQAYFPESHVQCTRRTMETNRSCITAGKESGRTSRIPETEMSNATYKKRNIGETFLKNDPSNYHFLDTDIYSESDGHDFQLFTEDPKKPKKQKSSEKCPIISFQQPNNASTSSGGGEQDSEAIAQMKDIIYGAAAFRPVNLGVDVVEKPKRKNVKISDDPQTVAARQRRERISDRIRVLQTLVPGGTKMDTASMLDEAANYLKFLRSRVKELEAFGQWRGLENYYAASTFACPSYSLPFLHPMSAQSYFGLHKF